jgi:hypothetical protein
MSDTSAALKAAREVGADTLAPELYRQAGEWFFKAKREYKFKNFDMARNHAAKARAFAESAEFEALRNGGSRTETLIGDPMASGLNAPPTEPPPPPVQERYDYPVPTPVPAEPGPGTGGGNAPPSP